MTASDPSAQKIKSPSGTGKSILLWGLVLCLLAVHLALILTASRQKSVTFDEVFHLTGGYVYWTRNDYRIDEDVAVFPDRIAALPLLWGEWKLPEKESPLWRRSSQFEISRAFLFELGNDTRPMVFQARAALAVFGLLLGVVVFAWSKKLFGIWGGLASMLLFCFSPNMIAHGMLVATDKTIALMLLAATGMVWLLMHRITLWTLLATGLVLGCLLAAKASGGLILPIAAGMLLVRMAVGRPLEVRLGKFTKTISSRKKQSAVFLTVFCIQVVVTMAMVWAFYGFRYEAFNMEGDPGTPPPVYSWEEELAQVGAAGPVFGFFREHRLLPEAFLYNIVSAVSHSNYRRAFALGRHSLVGWPWFFPYAMAVKTPLLFFPLVLLGLLALVRKKIPDPWYRTTPLLVLLFVYLGFALHTNLNIGFRHVMPLYPVFFILAGGAVKWAQSRRRVGAALVGILLAGTAAESLWVWPHSLAFFNLAAGGPSQGYHRLVDSSLDWGQDLPALADFLEENNLGPDPPHVAYLSYFGMALPESYRVRARLLPSHSALVKEKNYEPENWLPGAYCISATQLQQVYMGPMGKWCELYESGYVTAARALNKYMQGRQTRQELAAEVGGDDSLDEILRLFDELRLARLCAYLRQKEPDARVGWSILVYHLTQRELEEALFGEPVELLPRPTVEGRREAGPGGME